MADFLPAVNANTRPAERHEPKFARRRDLIAGLLLTLLGLGIVIKAMTYNRGTLMRMGPGFMPTILGAVLGILGVMISVAALLEAAHEGEGFLPRQREWRAWSLIILSPFVFMIFGTFTGLAPAIFATVFVAALADRTTTLRGAIILSAVVTVVGVALFSYVLLIAMPVVTWRGF